VRARYGATVINLVRIGGVLTVVFLGGFILLMLSGFSLFPPQASTLAPETDNLYLGIVAITAFFALIVVVFVVYFAIKYRDDTGDKVGEPITGWMPRELAWSLIPFFISIGIFVWASMVFFHIMRSP
jgi:cytochrome c oxidase subunit 2